MRAGVGLNDSGGFVIFEDTGPAQPFGFLDEPDANGALFLKKSN